MRPQAHKVILALVFALPFAVLLACALGPVSLPLKQTMAALIGAPAPEQAQLIVQQLRLPRVLLAALVGALLGCSGAASQGLFRNPLADPSLIGVTAGAMIGASLAIVFGAAVLGQVAMQEHLGLSLVSLGAFAGGVLAVALVYAIASTARGTSVATMLLAGIAITALAGSFNTLLEFIADNEMLRRISLWQMGGLDGANNTRLVLAALVLSIVLVFLLPRARVLNALLLGEREAWHLGEDVLGAKRMIVLLIALAVGAAIALAGTIAFVGLVVPHIMRMLGGPDHRFLLPASALAGSLLLVLSDLLARTVVAPTELPVGLITAAVGAPFFILLLRYRPGYAYG